MQRWEEAGWGQADLDKLELSFLTNLLRVDNPVGVAAAIAYARYLNMVGVNADNYPVCLKLIGLRNHWVTDARSGDANSDSYFSKVQPNYFILKECFQAFDQASRGGIYPKSLLAYLGILKVTYENSLEGYRVYPLTSKDVNAMGKHLDEEQDQRFELNAIILGVLDKVASLVDPGRPEEDKQIVAVATQANNIRGKFLDMNKSLNEAIPEILLQIEDYSQLETAPAG